MLNNLVPIKIHKDIIKTKFQTNIEEKRVFEFFKKDIFCVEFFSLQHLRCQHVY